MIFTEAPACLVPTPGYANMLAEPRVYRVNKVKRVVRPIHASISPPKPKEQHGRLTARHALRSSVALEIANVTAFGNIIRPFGSLALPKLSATKVESHQV
jgi:hypothetical protein